jgi:hypothetical protein
MESFYNVVSRNKRSDQKEKRPEREATRKRSDQKEDRPERGATRKRSDCKNCLVIGL